MTLWRETLLAKHVLEGRTKGYKNHPQLNRFKAAAKPTHAVNQYLSVVYNEALERGYNFTREKIDWKFKPCIMPVNKGQIEYEKAHLLNKLKTRDKEKYLEVKALKQVEIHPLFKPVKGDVEDWEIITAPKQKELKILRNQ